MKNRFFKFVDRKGKKDCWLWKGFRETKKGKPSYGVFVIGKKHNKAHRVSWMLHFGDPGKACVLHSCDNTGCVNPNHLFLGDYTTNNHDRNAKDRQAKGNNVPAAKLKPDQVLDIRQNYTPGSGLTFARKYGVSGQTILDVVRGVWWKHLPGRQEVKRPIGEFNTKSVLSEAEVKSIRREYIKGVTTLNSFALQYKVRIGTIHQIVTRKTWRHIK